MQNNNPEQEWREYREREIAGVTPFLQKMGFELEAAQPHIGGERYLLQAVTTVHGKKLILLGRRIADGKRVVIKATSDAAGARELAHERLCRTMLHEINFAYDVFFSPEEIAFVREGAYTISIQAFLEHERPFLERPTAEQFSLALKAFKAQEGAHATTYGHLRRIAQTFGAREAKEYLHAFAQFKKNIAEQLPENAAVQELLQRAEKFLCANEKIIEQYCGFLTHTDFVPHNFRIIGHTIYLLDYSSLRFGNKYEGWARFLNFMALYNPPLERALMQYVADNRTPEESLCLQLMRAYRLGEIIWYYADKLPKSVGNVLALNTKRIAFWSQVLAATLENNTVPASVITEYTVARDALRSDEEKLRQKGLH